MIEKLKKTKGGWEDEDGIFNETRLSYLQLNFLGLCGCGNSDEITVYIRDLLKKLDVPRAGDALKNWEWGDYEDLPYMFFVYWANEEGYAEHGCTVRCSWLTEKGEELLKDIEICLKKGSEADGRLHRT